MELSTDRILTTHVGSLPRPPQMLEVLAASGSFEQSKASANPEYDRRTREAVAQVVREQVQAGTDIVSDGEMGRVMFSVYATERLTGFESGHRSWDGLIEFSMFPEFFEQMRALPMFCRLAPQRSRGGGWSTSRPTSSGSAAPCKG